MSPRPPRLARRLLALMSAWDETFSSTGDFDEFHQAIARRHGAARAWLWYWGQVLRSLPAYAVFTVNWRVAMLKNYARIVVRNVKRHKMFAVINILGLAVGFAGSLLVMLYVMDELRYDTFHENAPRIYRVTVDATGRGDFRIHQLGTPAPLAPTLLDTCPAVESATRLTPLGEVLVRGGGQAMKEERVMAAESSLFRIFSFPLAAGDARTALDQPGTVVLTRSAAGKYFGEQDPLGQTLSLRLGDEVYPCRISGIAADVPGNSHFRFDLLVSLATFEWSRRTDWFMNHHITYVLLSQGASPQGLADALAGILTTHAFSGKKHSWTWTPQPLLDIHLHSDLPTGREANGDITTVVLFSLIALLILVIAGINFVNLSTARSVRRTREVGVRKVLGARRAQLVKQFLGESVLFSLAALGLALVLAWLALPLYRELTGKAMSLDLTSMLGMLPALVGVTILVGILAGIYPAWALARARPAHALRNTPRPSRRASFRFRHGLVMFQFGISVLLIIGTLTIFHQLEYIRSADLGFDRQQVVVVHDADKLGDQLAVFKDQLRADPGIVAVTAARNIPGRSFSNIGIGIDGVDATDRNMTLDITACDPDFAATLKLEMLRGRFFGRDGPADAAAMVINEETVRYFGLPQPLGARIKIPFDKKEFTVIGVVRDIHYESLHTRVKRMGLVLPGSLFPGGERYVFCRVRPVNMTRTLGVMKEHWQRFAGGIPFDYSFLDETLNDIYTRDMQTGRIVALFSSLAVFISCLGIFGLAAYMTEQRTREIGIRKILGAGLSHVLLLLSRDTLRWVAVAGLVIWPVGYFVMTGWLAQFAYRAPLGVGVFLASGGITLLAALLAVGVQFVRAAAAAPVDSLRYE
ncbi:MAG: ABC transporter permease [Acidobacteria bacterium]|nr:ABC transporter permease [Acidobacteriota bacterium]